MNIGRIQHLTNIESYRKMNATAQQSTKV